ncbi:MAG: 1-deoxy-D-xylulose-5-phosphate synthase N-terminal domain-containing protein, partial [Achromobacter sp.]
MTNTELLDRIHSPDDLKGLDRRDLKTLAGELRGFVLESVSATGGHLSSNLGTVELTLALHHVFATPHDRIVWDVGHQSYPHKILTGRRAGMTSLRQQDGISGFPKRSESEYDAFGTAHSSTSISAALGMAVASGHYGLAGPQISGIGDWGVWGGGVLEASNNSGGTPD